MPLIRSETAPQAIVAGDRVLFAGRYVGEVQRVIANETAEVIESAGRCHGRPTRWRLPLRALMRIEAQP